MLESRQEMRLFLARNKIDQDKVILIAMRETGGFCSVEVCKDGIPPFRKIASSDRVYSFHPFSILRLCTVLKVLIVGYKKKYSYAGYSFVFFLYL